MIGPKIVGPRDHSAGAAFAYEPPEGFVQLASAEVEGGRAWVFEPALDKRPLAPERVAAPVRVALHHSSKEMSVEESDLSKLALEMPKAFEDACTWVHRRHELRTRSDGARVGLMEGDCNRDVELGGIGLPPQTLRSRKLQLMFPDDDGTSIVTASYPTDQAARWEPLFEATIAKARGVATRVPAPPGWTYAAWAAAGAVLGWLATALVARGRPPEPPPKPRTKGEEAAT